MPSAATHRSIGLVLAVAVTAAILGSIAQIAATEHQAALAAHRLSATPVAVACDPAPDTRL